LCVESPLSDLPRFTLTSNRVKRLLTLKLKVQAVSDFIAFAFHWLWILPISSGDALYAIVLYCIVLYCIIMERITNRFHRVFVRRILFGSVCPELNTSIPRKAA
jgi:hypothetical protein